MGMFGVKNLVLNIGDCVYIVTRMITLNAVPPQFNWRRKRTIEDDTHLGSDTPHCQRIKRLACR